MPKKESERRRQNRESQFRVLVPDDGAVVPVLPLDGLMPQAVDEWERLWLSPLRAEFIEVDVGAALRFVVLVDRFWRAVSDGDDSLILRIGGELRILGGLFGLSPGDRRKLRVEVARSVKRPEPSSSSSTSSSGFEDPRLKAV